MCEEVNLDRFYPVLYAKVSLHYSSSLSHHCLCIRHILTFSYTVSPQASRLIVTFDEHVISNNFKFGVIYQKFGQVINTSCFFPGFMRIPSGLFSTVSEQLMSPPDNRRGAVWEQSGESSLYRVPGVFGGED